MIIFGVDPGTILTGFGVIHFYKNQTGYLKSGIIKPNPKEVLSSKLKFIYSELDSQLKKIKPDAFCIETAFLISRGEYSTTRISFSAATNIAIPRTYPIFIAD